MLQPTLQLMYKDFRFSPVAAGTFSVGSQDMAYTS